MDTQQYANQTKVHGHSLVTAKGERTGIVQTTIREYNEDGSRHTLTVIHTDTETGHSTTVIWGANVKTLPNGS